VTCFEEFVDLLDFCFNNWIAHLMYKLLTFFFMWLLVYIALREQEKRMREDKKIWPLNDSLVGDIFLLLWVVHYRCLKKMLSLNFCTSEFCMDAKVFTWPLVSFSNSLWDFNQHVWIRCLPLKGTTHVLSSLMTHLINHLERKLC
jgi:hypothetical protein